MTFTFTGKKRIRKNFGKVQAVTGLPNLLELQLDSYKTFLELPDAAASRSVHGLKDCFSAIFPIKSSTGNAELDFVSYVLSAPKFDVDECQTRDMTFAAPLRGTLRLAVYDMDADTGARRVKDIKEQEVYLCDLPLMTENGTFIVNGTERVVVSQMHRSPGVFFDHDKGTTHSSGKLLFAARVIPIRGSWLDFEFDHKDNMFVRIDRRRKLPATVLLRALGMSTHDILKKFYDKVAVRITKGAYALAFTPEFYQSTRLSADLVDADSGETVAPAGRRLTARAVAKIVEGGTPWVALAEQDLLGRYLAEDLVDKATGEVLFEAGAEITADILEQVEAMKMKGFNILKIDSVNMGGYVRNTLQIDKATSREDALVEIYRVMRPGEPPTVEAAAKLFNGLFFEPERYDLSHVGRMKMNVRLGYKDVDDAVRVLRKEDIVDIINKLVEIKDGRDTVDDIDHLSNRRVRSVGELLESQFRVGLLRMERTIRERMASADIATLMPQDLVNARPLASAMREFFSSSQLSQFMDQNNPLSEVTHKRRLSALGPGGLTRERAGFEVRDVHPSHYGRICPIETPEGSNIGLINALSTFARVNKYGFIETPYRKVVKNKATDDVVYMSAIHEMGHTIAQANTKLSAKGEIVDELVVARRNDETILAQRETVDFMDVSPRQVVSIAAALIPFLENDDANRALMGSNMQRQAVPLLRSDAPLVGTGMEGVVAADSGATVLARRAGVIEYVDASRIVVKATEEVDETRSGVDIYRLAKFRRSNQNTSMTQVPLVKTGDKIARGDIIADGPCTDLGELALGRNVLVAFMPWNGYNFEDSVLLSERIAKDDIFTSVHIDEFEVMARDTKLGAEEITRDIPNVGEEALSNLDESGIISIGAEIIAGDILVGKITPKGETPMTPEEKLLRAIFGEKAADVRDTSLRVPPGMQGTVVGVKVFNRRGAEKDPRTLQIEEEEISKLRKDLDDERRIYEKDVSDRLKALLLGEKTSAKMGKIAKGTAVSEKDLEALPWRDWFNIAVTDSKVQSKIEALQTQFEKTQDKLKKNFDEKVGKIRGSDELSPGVLKMVKVYLAVKRKMQPGDKMAGRHGNKGVVSRIVPEEDMPFMADGRPVDMVLNPLGVPSRMNVGQILETHLGWAAATIGRKISALLDDYNHSKGKTSTKELRTYLEHIYKEGADTSSLKKMSDAELVELAGNLRKGVPMATPVFDGATEQDIADMLEEAGLATHGQSQLYDGRSGDKFDRLVTVGYIYMLKLNHLVDEKIHARSIGPYSLVTQQPLGGRAQFGGQRFGEMEVWALEAYGASYTLQEMLTVKSDDVSGRKKTYEAIVRGEDNFESGVPESFNVLVQEMKALGLDVNLQQAAFEAAAEDATVTALPKRQEQQA